MLFSSISTGRLGPHGQFGHRLEVARCVWRTSLDQLPHLRRGGSCCWVVIVPWPGRVALGTPRVGEEDSSQSGLF